MIEDITNKEVKEEETIFKISIEFRPEGGGLRVQAPGNNGLFDEPISFWMLEKAKDFIKINNARAMKEKKSNLYVPDRMKGRG